jgi:hypothetical protein
VSATEAAIEANSFGDGVYAVGTDIVAGTYHTDGGDGCYYAEYGADGTELIDNGFTDASGHRDCRLAVLRVERLRHLETDRLMGERRARPGGHG